MDILLRGATIYAFLLLIFRLSGKRTLSNVTTFDFVLLLVIAEVTQQGLLGEDYSVTNALLLIVTLIGLDIGLSLAKERSPRLSRWLEGLPVVIVEDGRPIQEHMDRERVDLEDVLVAAREKQGLERLEQIKYAVLERNGGITVVPRR